jgi:hypothetical protein
MMTMTLSGDGTITGLVAGGLPDATITTDELAAGAALNNAPNSVGFRNRIINGDMRIDQRNAGASVTVNSTTPQYPVDRFFGQGQSTDGVFTVQQSSTAPSGFSNSVLATITTTDASIGATQYYLIGHRIEGFNTSDLAFGTASAKTITVSFWVRSSLTGTFGGSVMNDAFDRSYPFNYTISSANTWEQKSITIPGDTTGTWVGSTNGIGLRVFWGLGIGSTYSGTAGAWAGSLYLSTTGATSVVGTTGATFYITGVQLEVGSVATPFERRPFGTELALCYRYYYKITTTASNNVFGSAFNDSSTVSYGLCLFPVTMRTAPTAIDQNGTAGDYRIRVNGSNFTLSSVPAFDSASPFMAIVNLTTSGLTGGQAGYFRASNSNGAYLGWSAEL